jgi:division/cell wall cluster transcriptional repressor MraZ
VDLFIGKQECSVDDKRRWSLPPKYRPLFGNVSLPSGHTHLAVLIPWYGGALAVLPMPRWETIQARLAGLDYTTPDFLEATRVCLPRMERVHSDPEGRLTLTSDHHEWLRLGSGKSRIMVVGAATHLEVWNADEWPVVERTGRNTATRPASDVEYDRKLESLMRAALGGVAAPEAPPTV